MHTCLQGWPAYLRETLLNCLLLGSCRFTCGPSSCSKLYYGPLAMCVCARAAIVRWFVSNGNKSGRDVTGYLTPFSFMHCTCFTQAFCCGALWGCLNWQHLLPLVFACFFIWKCKCGSAPPSSLINFHFAHCPLAKHVLVPSTLSLSLAVAGNSHKDSQMSLKAWCMCIVYAWVDGLSSQQLEWPRLVPPTGLVDT